VRTPLHPFVFSFFLIPPRDFSSALARKRFSLFWFCVVLLNCRGHRFAPLRFLFSFLPFFSSSFSLSSWGVRGHGLIPSWFGSGFSPALPFPPPVFFPPPGAELFWPNSILFSQSLFFFTNPNVQHFPQFLFFFFPASRLSPTNRVTNTLLLDWLNRPLLWSWGHSLLFLVEVFP